MDNVTVTQDESAPAPAQTQEVLLTDIEITNENLALNVLVSFLGVAQKRGSFSIAESAKIYECIKMFVSKADPSA